MPHELLRLAGPSDVPSQLSRNLCTWSSITFLGDPFMHDNDGDHVHLFRRALFGGTALLPLDVTIWKTQHHDGDCGMEARGLNGLGTDYSLL